MSSEVVNVSLRDALYAGDWKTLKKYVDKCRMDDGAVAQGDTTSETLGNPNQNAINLLLTRMICEGLTGNMDDVSSDKI